MFSKNIPGDVIKHNYQEEYVLCVFKNHVDGQWW